ncbi:hypothetical protein [Micromonospora sp. NPDC005305]|uniref:hypothetical protein n=1 Tax=Micromonospora sp. NPDC005305 TaxID=3156875 RepID=UPI0033B5FB9F
MPPQSLGKISYEFGPVLWALFYGAPGALPKPEGEGSNDSECSHWSSWLSRTADLYVVDPVIDFALEGNDADVVVISKVEAKILSRVPARNENRTFVKCLYGGGSNEFYNVTLNTVTGKAMVREESLGAAEDPRPYPLPPAAISLSEGGHTGVRIELDSLGGYFYEGILQATTSINGEEKVISIGSQDAPFRWVTPDNQRFDTIPSFNYVGWDPQARRWVDNYSPWSQ